MDAITENTIRRKQIESFGRLMAGFAHDMKNHLGIIRESNGLMGDLLGMGDLGEDEKLVERLQKSIAAIERRVVISANMLHHLSGLAHRADEPYSSFLINTLIEEEYTFLERFSRLKQIEVALELQEGLPAVYSDPALLQHIFYRIYRLCLEQLDSGQSLSIVTEQENNSMAVLFRFPKMSQIHFDAFGDDSLQAAIKKLEGKLELADNGNESVDIRLSISSLAVAP